MARPVGAVGAQTARRRAWLRELVPSERERELWNRHLSDPQNGWAAFQKWNEYMYGKPVQPVSGDADGGAIKISVESRIERPSRG